MEKITTAYTEAAIRELTNKRKKMAIVQLVLFAVLLTMIAAYLVIQFVWLHSKDVVPMIAFGVLALLMVTLNIMLLLSNEKLVKTTAAKNLVLETQLEEESMFSETFRDGEKIEEVRQFYKDIKFFRETEHYCQRVWDNNTVTLLSKVNGLAEFLTGKGVKQT